jgi:hypothetical protein
MAPGTMKPYHMGGTLYLALESTATSRQQVTAADLRRFIWLRRLSSYSLLQEVKRIFFEKRTKKLLYSALIAG